MVQPTLRCSEYTPFLVRYLTKCSLKMPIFHYYDWDEGWGYLLYKDGQFAAQLDVRYGIEYYRRVDLVRAYYPDAADPFDFLHLNPKINQQLSNEVIHSSQYAEKVKAQYQRKNLHEFAVFGVSQADLDELDNIISAEWYLSNQSIYAQVENFKIKLGFPKMTWIP